MSDTCGCNRDHAQPPEWERAEDEPGLISRSEARRAYEAVDGEWFLTAERKAIDDHFRSVAKDGRAARAVARVQLHHGRRERGSRHRYRAAVVERIATWQRLRDEHASNASTNRRWASGYTRSQRAGAFARQAADYEVAAASAKRQVERLDKAIAKAGRILARLEGR